MKIFISYSHYQADWVRDSLYSCLNAGGAEVLIDVKRFQAGFPVYQQMDVEQDSAELQLLVLSPEYLASSACAHEMKRAIDGDPNFFSGRVIPVIRAACTLPPQITIPNPLRVNLTDDTLPDQWKLLLDRCEVDLGAEAPTWLSALRDVRTFVERNECVNLRVIKNAEWRGLLNILSLPQVDLSSGATVGRRQLIAEMLKACGHLDHVRKPDHDLTDLHTRFENSVNTKLTLCHFDLIAKRDYNDNFFWALNYLVDRHKLVLLVQSRERLSSLVPASLSQSGWVAKTKVVELRGR